MNGDSNSDLVVASFPGSFAFEDYKTHFSGPRQGTEVIIAESLREHFPGHHVTCTRVLDILEYASAGHATCTAVLEDERFDSTREYQRPKHRSEPGNLSDAVRFGRYSYSWKGTDFIVFQVRYQIPFQAPAHMLYLLAPRDQGEVVNGRHSRTEKLLFEASQWGRLLHNEVYVFDSSYWSKSKDLWKSVQDSSWDDVIMDQKTKDGLIQDVEGFFDSKDLYREFSVPWKRGIILHGAPGNGKTMTLKALMCALSKRPEPIPALYVKSLRSCDGPQYSVSEIFGRARSVAPCLLILEDLDSLITRKVRSYFLNEVDGIESGDLGILIIGTTNHLSKLDPAISQRPSRFDRKYFFSLPGLKDRISYCQYWKDKLSTNERIQFPGEVCDIIGELTEGFTFAYMKELFVAALLSIARGSTGDEDEPKTDISQDTPAASDSKEAPQKSKHTLPEVEIPSHLQENVLLKVFMQQATILLAEMDSTHTEKNKKKGGAGSDNDNDDGGRDYRRQMRMLARHRARQSEEIPSSEAESDSE